MTKTRVVVIGAGIIGVMCALRLAEAGCSVTIVEQGSATFQRGSHNASMSAAGMLAPLSEAAAHAALNAHVDELAFASFELWRARARVSDWSRFVTFDGSVMATKGDAAAALLEKAALAGRRVVELDERAVREQIGATPERHRAFFVEAEGVLDPIQVHAGLMADAKRRGIVFIFDFDFGGLGSGVVYRAAHDPLHADHIVVAPGVWSSAFLIDAAPVLARVLPAKGELVEIASAHPLRTTLHAPGFYIARRWDSALILGATMEMGRDDLVVDRMRIAGLVAAANAFFGGGVAARPGDSAWAGVRPMSPDWAPMIGPTQIGKGAGALIAAGHSRNGWLLAPITAEIICAYVMGREIPPLWAAFHPDRFESQI